MAGNHCGTMVRLLTWSRTRPILGLMSELRTNPQATVIVSTYDAPESLRMVLIALRRQTILPAEVMVADDGSPESTRKAMAFHYQ